MRRVPLRTSALRAALALTTALVGAGCTGSEEAAAPGKSAVSLPPRVLPSSAAPSCAPARPSTVRWPSALPADLPVPPGISELGKPRRTSDGVTVLQFTTATTLRDGVLFLLDRMRPAGYTLGRGDTEPNEADAPFVKGQLQGVFRMLYSGPCTTQWLLAVARRPQVGGNPLLPPRPGVTPTPLPFG